MTILRRDKDTPGTGTVGPERDLAGRIDPSDLEGPLVIGTQNPIFIKERLVTVGKVKLHQNHGVHGPHVMQQSVCRDRGRQAKEKGNEPKTRDAPPRLATSGSKATGHTHDEA